MPKMWGYQASRSQDGGCSKRKENMLNKHSKQDFILITLLIKVAPILSVVRDLFQTFHLDGFDTVQISNDCTCTCLT